MRTVLAIASFALLSASACAQLDRLLTPVARPPALRASDGRTVAGNESAGVAEVRTTLGGDAFLGELEKELTARMSVTGELKLSLTRPWQPVKLPAPDFAIAITELPTGGLSGTFFLRVKVSSGGVLVGDWQVPVAAQLWQEVWVASSRLDRGQALDRTLLAAQKVDVLREKQPLISAETDPSSLDLTMSVAAGRPLTRRDVVVRPVIRKGQVVEVVAQQGLLAISMKALALESGAAGDLIKLRNLESRREINGQIINESKVQIHF